MKPDGSILIVAHRILIATAIVFGIFFTVWELAAYRRSGELRDLVIGLVSALVTVAMAYYLKNLSRFVS